MLNEHERRTLHEVERQFLTEDPNFPRSFDASARRLDRKRPELSTSVAITIAVVLCTFMLAVGSPDGALGFAISIWMVWWAWRDSHRRRHKQRGQHE